MATTTVQLNQVLAVEKGVKATAASELAAAQQALANSARLSGISRTYRPRDEEGEALPAESTRVQVRAKDILTGLRSALSRLFDVTLTKDVTALAQRVAKLAEAVKVAREQANTAAVADAKIGEAVFSYLLG